MVTGRGGGLLAGLIGLATVAIVQAPDNDRLSKANAATSGAGRDEPGEEGRRGCPRRDQPGEEGDGGCADAV